MAADRIRRCRSTHNGRRCQRRAGHGWFHLRFGLFGYYAWAPEAEVERLEHSGSTTQRSGEG